MEPLAGNCEILCDNYMMKLTFFLLSQSNFKSLPPVIRSKNAFGIFGLRPGHCVNIRNCPYTKCFANDVVFTLFI